jgi:hypothetical protein
MIFISTCGAAEGTCGAADARGRLARALLLLTGGVSGVLLAGGYGKLEVDSRIVIHLGCRG